MAKQAPTVPRIDGRTFLVLAYDSEGSEQHRDTELDGHLAHIEKHCDRYLICGPIHNQDRSALIGSFFVVVAAGEDEAKSFLQGDPYFSCGMYKNVSVQEITAAGGRLMGGVIWESADSVRGN